MFNFSDLFGQASYDKLWQQVECHERDGHPKDALGEVLKIRDLAEKNHNFPQLLKSSLSVVNLKANIDPDTFQDEIKLLEKKLGNRTNSVEQSVADAMLYSAYSDMRRSFLYRFDDETKAKMDSVCKFYKSRVLDNMEALASASAEDYVPLVDIQDDGKLYNHDMLYVMLSSMLSSGDLEAKEKADLCSKAADIYKAKGMKNAYALMMINALDYKSDIQSVNERLSEEKHIAELYDLMMGMIGEEACADVMIAFYENYDFGIWRKSYLDKWGWTFNDDDDVPYTDKDMKLTFLKWAIDKVGKSKMADNLKKTQEDLLVSSIDNSYRGELYAGKSFTLTFNYWNCDKVKYEIREYAGKTNKGELLESGKLLQSKELIFGNDDLNAVFLKAGLPMRGTATDSIVLSPGHYAVFAKGVDRKADGEVLVTSIRMIKIGDSDKNTRLFICDNETGRPIANATLETRDNHEKPLGSYVTDAKGFVSFPNGKVYSVRANNGSDTTSWETCYSWRYDHDNDEEGEQISGKVYTDRSIYRPGQKVMANVLVYKQKDDDVKVVVGEKLDVLVKDCYGKNVANMSLSTNESGTANFECEMPEGCDVGKYSVIVSNSKGNTIAHANFRVEEYKRPTFDVKIKNDVEQQQSYSFGNTIIVKGEAKEFSGVPVQGGKVAYNVSCSPCSWRFWTQNWQELSSGELTTDDNGQFDVPVELTDKYLTSTDGYVQFRVKATVVDQKGETHEAQWIQGVSKRDFGLLIQSDSQIDKAKGINIVVEAKNVAGNTIPTDYVYYIDGDSVAHKASTDDKLDLSFLPVGNHRITIKATDSHGYEIMERESFWVYDSSMPLMDPFSSTSSKSAHQFAPSPRFDDEDVFYAPSSKYSETTPIDLYFSTRETDAYIIYNVYGNSGILQESAFVTDGSMKHLRLKYRKEWGEGILVQVTYVRNGHFYTEGKSFTYVEPEKRLNLSWQTFRNKLQPGQKEEWTLTVKDANGNAVSNAEVMALLYDASLDRITSHSWQLWLSFPRQCPRSVVSRLNYFSWPATRLRTDYSDITSVSRAFDNLVRYKNNRFADEVVLFESVMAAPMAKSNAMGGMVNHSRSRIVAVAKSAGPMLEESMDASMGIDSDIPVNMDFSDATIRTNFNETAFFLPHLLSDKTGAVKLSFTLPESLTEWKFMGLVHTNDMCYGQLTDKITASKAFTLRPNMPRFVRWGDEAVVTAAVINQSEEKQEGTVRLRLINPDNGVAVIERQVPFSTEAGKTSNVDFSFEVEEGWLGMNCEIVAVSGDVSDGEKNYLPVLSTKQEVVESVPFYVMGKEDGSPTTQSVDVSSLYNKNSKTATNRNLKVEYTDNPSWMCVDALRSIKLPEEDDAISYAASFYANTRLLEFSSTFPILEKYEKSVELKTNIDKADSKLKDMQLSDGGWCWFRGMESSYYVTVAVCENLAKLPSLTAKQESMLLRALDYVDAQELKYYNERKKYYKTVYPSESTSRYLYLMSLRPNRNVSRSIASMREEYLCAIEKNITKLTLYGVANSACALRVFGHTKSADSFVESLKQHSVLKPNQGRCFTSDAAYYSWVDYRIPTHVAAMQALCQAGNSKSLSDSETNAAYLRDMQLWLLSQKQVQKWDNPMNTINVVDLLLKISPQQTFHESKLPVISLDGRKVENFDYGTINTERDKIEGREANLSLQGNVLAEIPSDRLTDGVAHLEVKKSSPSISWGAAYATFLEDIGNLNSYATQELRIERKLYYQPSGNSDWLPYSEDATLKVGDKLRIRLIVSADRDMDFVRVSSQHPACLESIGQLSGYQRIGSRGAYVKKHDSYSDVFFDWLTRGTTTFDLEYYISRPGIYKGGISVVECSYAKQFGSHTSGYRVHTSK